MTEAKVKRVLIAEREPEISETLCEYLEYSGFETVTAKTAEEVLLKVADEAIGVVIADHCLCCSTSPSVLEKLVEVNPGIVVIMMLSYPMVDYVIEAYRKGAFDVIVKPVDLFELDDILRRGFGQYEMNKVYHFVSKNLDRINQVLDSGQLTEAGLPANYRA
ncbi:MAG: response regulator [Candidatus Zixiibacteriota bacterium]